LVIPLQDIGFQHLGLPTTWGTRAYSGGLVYVFGTFHTTVDFGNGIVSAPTDFFSTARFGMSQQPRLAIDVGKDALWVFDLKTNALVASAWVTQVTATPAMRIARARGQLTMPALVVRVPGLQPLTIGSPDPRFSWPRGVDEVGPPEYVVSGADWRTLVGKFGVTAPPPTSRNLQWIGRNLLGLGVLLVIMGGPLDIYGYRSGTPTTATVANCYHSKTVTCTASWRIGGELQTGPIEGQHPVGASVDVHVSGGRAYTAPSVAEYFLVAAGAGSLIVALVLFVVSRRRASP
jgi:hypothetical protein